jgi:hypothetical protein
VLNVHVSTFFFDKMLKTKLMHYCLVQRVVFPLNLICKVFLDFFLKPAIQELASLERHKGFVIVLSLLEELVW